MELERELAQRIEARDRGFSLRSLYPDSGPLRRELYPKHLDFFRAGTAFDERAIIAANRVGKTTAAGYEVTLHLTGRYPDWWDGARFTRPIEGWACGVDAKQVRDTIQEKLLGKLNDLGTGIIPAQDIMGRPTPGGVPESVDTVRVQHTSGGVSLLGFKNYEQDRQSYQGTAKDFVWYDEEPPMPIYSEGLTRTMSTVPGQRSGLVMCTFTPLLGISEVVMAYLPELRPSE